VIRPLDKYRFLKEQQEGLDDGLFSFAKFRKIQNIPTEEARIRAIQDALFRTYEERKILSPQEIEEMKAEPISLSDRERNWRQVIDERSGSTILSAQSVTSTGKPLPFEKGQSLVGGAFKIELRRLFADPSLSDAVDWLCREVAEEDLMRVAFELQRRSGGAKSLGDVLRRGTVLATATQSGAELYRLRYGMTIVDPAAIETFPEFVKDVEKFQRLALDLRDHSGPTPKYIVHMNASDFWETFRFSALFPRWRGK
jgi:hypothetical protein